MEKIIQFPPILPSTDWSINALKEFQNSFLSINARNASSNFVAPSKWDAPPHNQLRLDIATTHNDNINHYAVGGVVRDHTGRIVLAFGRNIERPPSVVYADLLGICEGMKCLAERNVIFHIVASDSLLAVQAVNRLHDDFTYLDTIAMEVKKLFLHCRVVKLIHMRRIANQVARAISNFAVSSPSPFV